MPASEQSIETRAYVALGANLGDPVHTIRAAMDRLAAFSSSALHRSSLWRTTPVDCPPGSSVFVNAVAGLQPFPGETPETLLVNLQTLEKEFGRRPKTVLNEARPLDLDLIAFASEQRNTSSLILPHPRAHLRRFVLQPLSEIAPDLLLPGQSETVSELIDKLPIDPTIERVS
jgi:2-amino-4-hydroxy-6-hydroxymethyldihydropteridine diphosphokinase